MKTVGPAKENGENASKRLVQMDAKSLECLGNRVGSDSQDPETGKQVDEEAKSKKRPGQRRQWERVECFKICGDMAGQTEYVSGMG